MKQIFGICLVMLAATGCYRMPAEDEVRVVPNTNNPHVVGGDSGQWMPTVDY